MKIGFKKVHPDAMLPKYAHDGDAGMDVYAVEDVKLRPLEPMLVKTGLVADIPTGYEIQVRPRSGLALKHGITCINTPGTVDADYRGEVGVLLVNLGNTPFVINDGERIAQMVVARHEQVAFESVDVLDETERGDGGYGHSGVK